MIKKKHKIIAFLLAIALLTTAIGTNHAFTHVFAEEQTQETAIDKGAVEETDKKVEDQGATVENPDSEGTKATDEPEETTKEADTEIKEDVAQTATEEKESDKQPEAEEQKTIQATDPAVQANGVTMNDVETWMSAENRFPHKAFRDAILKAIEDFYEINDDGIIQPSDACTLNEFSSPEEVIGWLQGDIAVTEPQKSDNEPEFTLEGCQYLGKMVWESGNTDVPVITVNKRNNPGLSLQTYFGESNDKTKHEDAVIYAHITINNGIISTLTDRGQIGNDFSAGGQKTIADFRGGLTLDYLGRQYRTAQTVLTYIRNQQEKNVFLNSDAKKNNGEQLTLVGETREALSTILKHADLKEKTEAGWKLQFRGESAKGNINLYFTNWDSYQIGNDPDNMSFGVSYTYMMNTQYYSSVNVNLQNQVYGGFTFTKTSENDANLNLSGASYVVKKEGKYLSRVGGNNQEAEFTDDITKAKVFETNKAGTFEVSPVPEGKYEVIEVKAPAGYKLNATPVSVEVIADKTGIATDYAGAEGNSLTVNADETTLTPHWDQGNNNKMTVSGDTTTKTADMFIKNRSEGGKEITRMKYELLNTADKKYTTLQEPEFTVNNLKNKVVKDNLKDLDAVKDYINKDIIGTSAMQYEWDSYNISSSKDLIYYDTTSVAKCVATQTDTPLPINLEFDATKTLIGGDALVGREFEFTLEPDKENPNDDPFKGGMTVTNDATGKIDLGQVQFTKAGTYKYTLKETNGGTLGNDPGITYDTDERSIEIKVEETGENGLTATVKITVDGKTKEKTYTSVDTNKVSYRHLNGNDIQNDKISQTVKEKYEKVDAAEFVNSKGLMIEKTSPQDKEKVSKGDTITYEIVVKNPNPNDDQKTKVFDSIPAQLELVKCAIDGKETDWKDGTEVTVPKATKDKDGNTEFGQTTIKFTCKVKAEYMEDDMEQNFIINQAYMEQNGKKTYTKTVANVLLPSADYKMSKVRITSAPKKGDSNKEYGFTVGTKNVYYEQTIENTGNLDLSMKVGDAFSDELDANGKAASDNFENLKIVKVVITDKDGKSETYETDNADVFTGFETANGELKKLPAGATAVITYSADVKTDATESLDSKAFNKKDKDGSEDKDAGYQNTAEATGVKTSYEKPNHITIKNDNGDVIFEATVADDGKIDVTTNKDEEKTVGGKKPEIESVKKDVTLQDTTDTDRTPVQVPKASYTMEKSRITNADPNGNTKTYGFVRGDKVKYQVMIKNTGDMPLTMDVTDSFADTDKFEDLKVETVEGATENGDIEGSVGKNITIEAGKTAVITFSAVVATDNVNLDDAENRDWSEPGNEGAKGYLNTAKTENVSAKFTYKDAHGKEQTIIYTEDGRDGTVSYPQDNNGKSELENKEDVANTPVRPVPSFEISKTRIEAPESDNVPGKYGFRRGETVTYTITVANTGTMDLTMTVEDKFADSNYFTDLTYTKVEGAAWNNNVDSTATTEVPNITVKAGETAVITVTAKVADITPEKLSDKAEYYKGANGYQNTVIAKIKSGTYTYIDENGIEQQVTVDPEDYPKELKDKKADCTTPVQVREPEEPNGDTSNHGNHSNNGGLGSRLLSGPKTGDNANWGAYLAIAILSLMAITAIVVRRKRNR